MTDTTAQYARKSPLGADRYREIVAAMRRLPKPAAPPPVAAAEDIANTVEDLRKGRAGRIDRGWRAEKIFDVARKRAALPGPVVDATAIYQSLSEADKDILIYEDHPNIAPPWGHAVVAYQNGHGNIVAMDCTAYETNGTQKWAVDAEDRPDDPPVEWDRVRWVIETFIWIGGQSGQGKRLGTSGPAHMWRFAIYPDGEPADLSWVHLRPDYPMEYWDMAYVTLLGALNFLNCRNVELVDPQRPRPQARRIARTGVTVKTLNVFPVGRSSRSGGKDSESGGVPLTSVRGHFASYGEQYERGLLFGKYEGRFWRPQHARGDVEQGENRNDYQLKP